MNYEEAAVHYLKHVTTHFKWHKTTHITGTCKAMHYRTVSLKIIRDCQFFRYRNHTSLRAVRLEKYSGNSVPPSRTQIPGCTVFAEDPVP